MRLLKALIILIALAIILGVAREARSQMKDVQQTLDAVLNNARTTALNSSRVKWDSLREVVTLSSANAKTTPDLKYSFEVIFKSLDDQQAVIFDPATMTRIAGCDRQPSPSNEPLTFFLAEEGIAYIRLPASGTATNADEYANAVRAAVDSLTKDGAIAWIIDLRYAANGDSRAMLAGLAPLFEEGLVATTVDNRKKINDMYTVHNGNLYINQVEIGNFGPHQGDLSKTRIAILTSAQTRGAAEIVSIGFKGRKNTKFFGEQTAGDIFATTTINIAPNLSMRLSSMLHVDKRGREYLKAPEPDLAIEFSRGEPLDKDKAIREASMWLIKMHKSGTEVASLGS